MARKDEKPDKATKTKLRTFLTGKGVAAAEARQLAHENDDNATAGQIEADLVAWLRARPKG